MIIHVKNKEEFLKEIKEGKVLVDFYATWCGPCNMLAPVLEEIKNEIKIIKVDVDEASDIAQNYGIASIPTLILFENNTIIKKSLGYLNINQLRAFIS